jgi:hypothetical protein
MNKTILAAAVLALAFAACGGGAGSSPESTFEAMRQAAINKDGGTMYDLLSPEARKQATAGFEQMKDAPPQAKEAVAKQMGITAGELDSMTPRDFFALMMEKNADDKMVEEAKSSKIVESKVEGDKATLTVETNGEKETVQLIRVDGKWFLESFN